MKSSSFLKKLTLVCTGLLMAFASSAQPGPVKSGFARVEYILSQLPEIRQIESTMQSLQKQLENQVQAKNEELKKKYAEFIKIGPTAPEAVRNNAQRELQQLQENLEILQQDAQTTLEKKQTQLIEPVYVKIGKTIEDVAKENGFQLVFSDQTGGGRMLLYGDPLLDISDLVLKKMGVVAKTPGNGTGN
ncbi:OmpH family outer membrane protein [Chryseolinea soli]|uniref:OmpH family outer membrane protein n=1 Tax=Chryseolinea soli TaxID=2321403 RepID=A0A385SHU9_9BACT|nr:OmpH family outer membrane protein [Chryseolinea soli]AYB30036.1 OmpH family outer membrane protein [Chryseolinea soli]